MAADVLDVRKARSVLRDAARRHIRLNAYTHLRGHNKKMPAWAFAYIVAFLAATRVACIATLIIAWGGWWMDPRYWYTGAKVVSDHVTPFHGHPNLFGWRFGFQGLVAMHNVTGALLFLVCLVPLFATKGGKVHVWFGRAFVVFWLLHLFDGLVNSGQLLVMRGFDPTHYFDASKQGFSLYLYIQFSFISSIVIDFLANGLAALQYKNKMPPAGMRALMLAMPITSLLLGVGMTCWGIYRVASPEPPATPNTMEFAIVFIVQVPAYIYLIGKNIAYWAKPTARTWLHGWVTEHQRNMMFCVQVTLYTGLANATMKYAPWLTPFLFGGIDVGFIVWLLVKEREIRRSVMGARLGFAFISLLRTGKRPAEPLPLAPADEKWIMKTFDLDGDGQLDANELRAILAAQGIDLSEEEIQRIKVTVDTDGSGKIDRKELASFLSGFFVSDPTYDDDLALAFRSLDKNGDGRLDMEELRSALGGRDQAALATTEVNRIFERLDTEKGGKVEWEDFAEAVESKRRGWTNPWIPTAEAEAQKKIAAAARSFPEVKGD